MVPTVIRRRITNQAQRDLCKIMRIASSLCTLAKRYRGKEEDTSVIMTPFGNWSGREKFGVPQSAHVAELICNLEHRAFLFDLIVQHRMWPLRNQARPCRGLPVFGRNKARVPRHCDR